MKAMKKMKFLVFFLGLSGLWGSSVNAIVLCVHKNVNNPGDLKDLAAAKSSGKPVGYWVQRDGEWYWSNIGLWPRINRSDTSCTNTRDGYWNVEQNVGAITGIKRKLEFKIKECQCAYFDRKEGDPWERKEVKSNELKWNKCACD